MSEPTNFLRRGPRGDRGVSRVAVAIAVAVVILAVGLVLAIPRFFGGEAPPETPTGPTDPAPRVETAEPEAPPPEAPPAPKVVTSADGDLVLELRLRFAEAISGASVPATVRFVNTSLQPFELPAPGEPHPTLALVILDAEGHEVRRVVESGPDPYPRRTATLAPAASIDLPATVVSSDDEPLAPGEYTVYAEMRLDPVWARLAVPFWKAPHGPVRSSQETLRVAAKAE